MMTEDRGAPIEAVDIAARRALMRAPEKPRHAKSISQEELRARLVKEALNNGLPADNSRQLDVPQDSQMTLPVTEIQAYDRNPRRFQNEQYEAIKTSIRAAKHLTSPLVVTRRPGQDKFMVGKGGNTRLAALQELFAETGDSAYQFVVVTYVPWESESATLAAHLVENELRGEMIFWDKANAYEEMKRLLEAEYGANFSGRAFEQALRERGLPLGRAVLGYYAFAVAQLSALGEAATALSIPKVRELQPVFLASDRLLRHFQGHEAWPGLRDAALGQAREAWRESGQLDTAAIARALDQQLAAHLGETEAFIGRSRVLYEQAPHEEVASLIAQARLDSAPPAREPIQAAPAKLSRPAPSKATGAQPPPRDAPALATIQDLASRFARVNGVADCLRLDDDWPTGFYVEVPENDEPIDLGASDAGRYHGWWMLAVLSRQLDGAWSARMPEDSTWRQAQRQERGRDEFALQHYMDSILGMPIDPLTLGRWFTEDPISVATWLELAKAVNHLRASAPERFRVLEEAP